MEALKYSSSGRAFLSAGSAPLDQWRLTAEVTNTKPARELRAFLAE